MKNHLLFSIFLLWSGLIIAQTTVNINTTTGGSLQSEFISHTYNPTQVVDLTITGLLDASDIRFMRDDLTALAVIDISGTSIVAYTGPNGPMVGNPTYYYPANELPYCAFFDPAVTHLGKPTLTSIQLPNTLNNIGNYSLQYCFALTSVTIPNSVDTIKQYAFKYDTALINVVIPAGVDIIDEGAFQQAGGVTVDAGNPNYSSLDGVLFNKNKTVLITCPITKYTYTVPASVDTLGLESFYGCKHLASVNIPTTVTYISIGAFTAAGLVSVTIPSSINRIEAQVFFLCQKLTMVNLPNSITNLSFGSFYGCTALLSIDIPASVDTIQPFCFYADSAMISVTLHSGLKYIGGGAFQACKQLTSILFPPTVSYIGGNAFFCCFSLSSIYASTTTPVDLSTTANVFYGVDTNTCILFVPLGSLALYQSANQWKDFNIIQQYDIGINAETTENFKVFAENSHVTIWDIPYGENVSVFTLQGIQIFNQISFNNRLVISLPSNGLYILRIGRKTHTIVSI
ncbi:MAG: leucine-rich repeat domain-containing protein [Bacteroidota bacterium]